MYVLLITNDTAQPWFVVLHFLLLILEKEGKKEDEQKERMKRDNTLRIVPRVSLTCCRGLRLGFMNYTSLLRDLNSSGKQPHYPSERPRFFSAVSFLSLSLSLYIYIYLYIYVFASLSFFLLPSFLFFFFILLLFLASSMYHFEQQKKEARKRISHCQRLL